MIAANHPNLHEYEKTTLKWWLAYDENDFISEEEDEEFTNKLDELWYKLTPYELEYLKDACKKMAQLSIFHDIKQGEFADCPMCGSPTENGEHPYPNDRSKACFVVRCSSICSRGIECDHEVYAPTLFQAIINWNNIKAVREDFKHEMPYVKPESN